MTTVTGSVDDQSLIVEAGNQSPTGWDWEELYSRVFPYARARTGNDDAAWDAILSASLSILTQAAEGTLKPVVNPGGLLYTAVFRKVVDSNRGKAKDRCHVPLEGADVAAIPAPPTSDGENQMALERLERILHLPVLTDDEKTFLKTVLEMKYLAGCTWQVVGARFGIGQSGACQRFFRLAAKLRRLRASFDLDHEDIF